MEIRWLETFVVLARERSLAAAAAELGYARSTVTHHLQALEKTLGAKLFDRNNVEVPLTASGQALLQHAELALEQLDIARQEVAQAEGHAGLELALGATESACAYRLPLLLRLLYRHLPDLQVNVEVGDTTTLRERVRKGQLSAVLVSATKSDVPTPAEPSRELWSERPVLVRGANLGAQESPVLVTQPGCVYREIMDTEYSRVSPTSKRVQMGSLEGVRSGVLSGMGIGLIPLVAAQGGLNSGEMVALPWQPHREVITRVTWNEAVCPEKVQRCMERLHAPRVADSEEVNA